MSLQRARLPDGSTPSLPPGPVPCFDLVDWVGEPFELPCDDPWLDGGGDAAHAYLDAAARGWDDHPEWMDFLDEDSPVHDLKLAERDLYLHHWTEALDASRVMDVGCGIGRFSLPFLDRDATVWAVDGDLQSLQRLVWHAAGRAGRLQVSWSSVRQLPDVSDLDVIISAEVLCYVPEAEEVLAELTRRLRPGGKLLLSWEAAWGWATAEDAPAEALELALKGEGVLDLPGDRWVRVVSDTTLAAMLESAGLVVDDIIPTHYTADGPLERTLSSDLSLEELLEIEARCRTHPVWAPLNRIWTATAHRPGS